jgi:amidohydrolase
MEKVDVVKIEQELNDYLIQTYKHLHQYPEPSRHEFGTQAFLKQELERIGVPYVVMAQTGLCATLGGKQAGKTILLRADMDALEIDEKSEIDFPSKNAGMMHACGHDSHMTVALGVIKELKKREDHLKGTVKIMFQPAEELPPGGAKDMIAEGILENPKVDAAIGIHTHPFMPAGKIGLIDGVILAASDRVYVEVLGKGGHAAAPHEGADAIVIATEFIQSCQKIISRRVSPLDPAVITFGKIEGGYRDNAIADSVKLGGTVRTIRAETQDFMAREIERLLQTISQYWGTEYSYEYVKGHPPTINDRKMTDLIRRSTAQVLGEDHLIEMEHCLMSGDDFAYLSRAVPSVFIEWGVGSQEKENYPWHHPKFHVDLSAFKYGVAVVTQSILNFLDTEAAEGGVR